MRKFIKIALLVIAGWAMLPTGNAMAATAGHRHHHHHHRHHKK
jgi:hypothetical protein